MRPTTKRRVIILAASTVGLAVTLGGVYEFRQYQINAKTLAYRAEGMDSYQHGDYAKALIPLSKYNERHPTDAETLFAFGMARSRVEAPNNRNLAEAIQYYRRGLELQPGNLQRKHELLDLYSNTGSNAEAIALADDLLKGDPKDVAALSAKAKALASRRQFAEALATSTRLNELAPTDIEGQGITLYLMSPWCLNKPAGEILGRAEKLLAEHPKDPKLPRDPRFVLLQGLAYHCALDDKNAREKYLQAAAHPPDDPEFVKICTNLMDEVGLFDKSQELLEQASAKSHDPRMLRMLIQRLWQNGRYEQVVDRLKDLDLNNSTTDAHLLAYRAFSLYQLQRDKEAKPIVDALAGRKDDDVALAWAKALSARFEEPDANPREKIQAYQAALVRDPGNSAIRYMMGESYARLGETELAIKSWEKVIRDVPSWPTPRVQVAYLLAATGRTQVAVEQAKDAYVAGQNLGSAIGLVVALATSLDSGVNPPDVAKVLALTADIQQKVPGEPQTLPIYVNLLARTGDKDKAVATVREALAKSYPIGADAWLRLAAVSRAQGLGLERTILDHAAKAYGNTPRLALANAVLLAESGKPDEGLKYLSDAAAKATGDQSTWKVTLAQFREHLHDPKAHDAWVEVGDQFPQDLAVQSTIIDLPDNSSAWADRDFIKRTIDRLHALTGDQGFHWQLARCRWLLTSPERQRDSADAIVTLSDIVRGSPDLVVPRRYLAKAMENVGDRSAAIEQLRAASEMDQDNASVALDLVRLLQADGKFDDAGKYLDRAARSVSSAPGREQVAMYYYRQGNLDAAIKVLAGAPAAQTDAATNTLLADLYRRQGNFDEATKLYAQLASAKDADAPSLAAAADYFAAHGKQDQAHAALDRLSQLKLPAGHRDAIVAAYTEKHGSKDAAADLYRKAVDANPTDPDLWRQLVGFQLRQNRFEQAAATCDAALAKVPGNEDLASLKTQALALRTTNGGPVDTDALVAELSKDPRNAAARDSLATYEESRRNNDPPDRAVQKLRRVADQYPRFLPVQTQVVRMYLQLGNVAEAVNVASRAVDNFPNDPEPAGLLTAIYDGTHRWNDVLTAAAEWRRRSLEDPLRPDVAIARARTELGQPAEAMQVLKPYMDAAKADPDKYNMVIGTDAQALIVDHREPEAAALLAPYLSRSDEWRTSTLRLASLVHGPAATEQWIDRVAAAVPADSLTGQYEIAYAWYNAGHRYPDHEKAYLTRARDVIAPLTKRPDVTAAVMLMAGSVAESLDDPAGAIAAYRRSLQIDPKQPIAENNLAYLLVTRNQDLDEARQLAERAVAAAPNDTSYYDTLAKVYEKVGKRDRAIATYQKILDLDPVNVQAMVPTIRLLRDEGRRDDARAMLAKLETVLQSNPALRTPDVDVQSLRQQL